MTAPAWLLLVWSGLGATCAVVIGGSLLGRRTASAWALSPRSRSDARAFAWTLIAGAAVYPLLYGIAFEVLRRSDVRAGLLLGLVHGALAVILTSPGGSPRSALRTAAVHVVYGIVIAFLYVTP